jgi:hypothetical protein
MGQEHAVERREWEVKKWHDYSRDCGLRSGAIDAILAHRNGVRAKDAAARGGAPRVRPGRSPNEAQQDNGSESSQPPPPPAGGDSRLSVQVQQMWQRGGEALRTTLLHGGGGAAARGGSGGRGLGSIRVPR